MEGLDRTIIEGGDGFGGASMLAGGAGFVGGLVLGSLWNGGFGGCGYRNGANGVVSAIDTSAITDAISQVNTNVSNLAMQSSQQACSHNSNIVNAVTSAYTGLTANLNANNISNMQAAAGIQNALCQGFSGVNTAVTTQGYESREATNALANQVAQCCCQITRAVEEQGCQNRQLQRQIQAEQVASQLCDAKAKIASLEAQQALSLSQQAQTAYLISQLKPTTAAAGA